jgi:hypothetical protein
VAVVGYNQAVKQTRQPTPPLSARPWYQDAAASLAFFALALSAGKSIARMLGPIAGLFFLLLTLGAGWLFGRAAWGELLRRRNKK